jgi:hypothetical protein
VSKKTVGIGLVAWLCVTWGAALLNFEHFPLTAARMYSKWTPKEVLDHAVVEKETYMRGLHVIRRDGSTDFLGTDELNLPRKHLYFLYYQKINKRPPFLIFRSLNKTLKHEPDDPEFIVRITYPVEYMHRRLSDVATVWRDTVVTDIRWDEAWRDLW